MMRGGGVRGGRVRRDGVVAGGSSRETLASSSDRGGLRTRGSSHYGINGPSRGMCSTGTQRCQIDTYPHQVTQMRGHDQSRVALAAAAGSLATATNNSSPRPPQRPLFNVAVGGYGPNSTRQPLSELQFSTWSSHSDNRVYNWLNDNVSLADSEDMDLHTMDQFLNESELADQLKDKVCPYCPSEDLWTEVDLEQHLIAYHKILKRTCQLPPGHRCNNCAQETATIPRPRPATQMKCPECGIIKQNYGEVYRCIQGHIKEKEMANKEYFTCPECGAHFVKRKAVTQHRKRQHGVKTRPKEKTTIFACEFCQVTLSRRDVLSRHLAANVCGLVPPPPPQQPQIPQQPQDLQEPEDQHDPPPIPNPAQEPPHAQEAPQAQEPPPLEEPQNSQPVSLPVSQGSYVTIDNYS